MHLAHSSALPSRPNPLRAMRPDPLVLVLLAWAAVEPIGLAVGDVVAEVVLGLTVVLPLLARRSDPAAAAGAALAAVLLQRSLGAGEPPLHASTAAALVAGISLGATAVRSPAAGLLPVIGALLGAQLLGAAGAGGWAGAGPQVHLTLVGVVLGGFAIGFVPRHRAERARVLRAQIATLERDLSRGLRAAAARERRGIAERLERLVADVTREGLPLDDAPSQAQATKALQRTERAARGAAAELRRLLAVLGAPDASVPVAAPRPTLRARLARLHAAYGPVVAFAALGVVEQVLLPERPHVLASGVVVPAAPYPAAAAMGLAIVTALPLLLRQRAPLVAIAGTAALLVARTAVGDLSSLTWSQNALGVGLAFAAGAFAIRTPQAVAGLAMAAAATAAAWALEQMPVTPFEWLYLAALLIGAWLAGRRMGGHVRAAARGESELEALRARRLRLTAEAARLERRRVAREVHDLVGHGLSLMSMHAAVGAMRLERGAEPVEEAVRRIRSLAAETERELAVLLASLYAPRAAGERGAVLAELRALVDTARRHGQPVELEVRGKTPLAPPAHHLVDVVREALTNARKHAGPAPVRVTLRAGDDAVEVEVVNAPGEPLVGPGTGSGLDALREAVGACGGILDAGPSAAGGWRLRCLVPNRAR
jgi:signal transduction histidine kinase